MALADSTIVFLVSLAIGAFGINIAAMAVTGESDYSAAVITALAGAVIWSVVGFFFGFIPLLGPLLALAAWIGVINVRYPGDWGNAVLIGALSWLTVLIVLYVLAIFNVASFTAVGIPGV